MRYFFRFSTAIYCRAIFGPAFDASCLVCRLSDSTVLKGEEIKPKNILPTLTLLLFSPLCWNNTVEEGIETNAYTKLPKLSEWCINVCTDCM
jgi:hypothetical protein